MSPPPTAPMVVGACLQAVVSLVKTLGTRAGVVEARLTIAGGAVAALGFKTAATLLKTLELRSWGAIATFAVILTLRTLIKRRLVWETGRLRAIARERS